MTKRDLIVKISHETGIPTEDVYAVIQRAFDLITDALVAGEHIEFRDFGVFEVKSRRPRIGRNPNKPEFTVHIPSRKIVKFKPGKKMRERVLRT